MTSVPFTFKETGRTLSRESYINIYYKGDYFGKIGPMSLKAAREIVGGFNVAYQLGTGKFELKYRGIL